MKKLIVLLYFISIVIPASGSNLESTQCICTGSGPIALVFDAGMGNWSLFFKPIASRLNGNYKICLLDRPGYSKLIDVEDTPNAVSIANYMKQLLRNEGITDSVILVGHSMGGLNVRMFQSLYPEKVIGMILIDAASPELFEKIPEVESNIPMQIVRMKKIKRFAKSGLLNFTKSQIPTFGLPDEYLKDYYKIVTKSFYYETYIQELEAFPQSIEQCKSIPNLGNLPLLVIASKQGISNNASGTSESKTLTDIRWIQLQKNLATLSSNSTYIESEAITSFTLLI